MESVVSTHGMGFEFVHGMGFESVEAGEPWVFEATPTPGDVEKIFRPFGGEGALIQETVPPGSQEEPLLAGEVPAVIQQEQSGDEHQSRVVNREQTIVSPVGGGLPAAAAVQVQQEVDQLQEAAVQVQQEVDGGPEEASGGGRKTSGGGVAEPDAAVGGVTNDAVVGGVTNDAVVGGATNDTTVPAATTRSGLVGASANEARPLANSNGLASLAEASVAGEASPNESANVSPNESNASPNESANVSPNESVGANSSGGNSGGSGGESSGGSSASPLG